MSAPGSSRKAVSSCNPRYVLPMSEIAFNSAVGLNQFCVKTCALLKKCIIETYRLWGHVKVFLRFPRSEYRYNRELALLVYDQFFPSLIRLLMPVRMQLQAHWHVI